MGPPFPKTITEQDKTEHDMPVKTLISSGYSEWVMRIPGYDSAKRINLIDAREPLFLPRLTTLTGIGRFCSRMNKIL